MSMQSKRQKLKNLINDTNGLIFTTVGYKKGDWVKGKKEVRVLTSRTGVTKHLVGGKSTTAGKEDLATVFDMEDGYRSIWLDGVISFKCKGVTITFEELPEVISNEV